jgi:hypothetical protein
MSRLIAKGWLPLLLLLPSLCLAQQGGAAFDASRMPVLANEVRDFVPAGWKIEAQVTGDLNGDAVPDRAVKLVEVKPEGAGGFPPARQRVLVVLLATREGTLSRAAVADKLLQCTACGGALYGAVEAPAKVTIQRGVLVISQDHGSRNLAALTFRFRYEPDSKRFVLIGLDYDNFDRVTGEKISESTNFLTQTRIATRAKNKKSATSKTGVPKQKISLEQADSERLEAEIAARFGMD